MRKFYEDMYKKLHLSEKLDNFYIKDSSREYLLKHGFRYSYAHDGYILNFPVCRYGDSITLFGRFLVNEEDRRVFVDVFDSGGGRYAPFYCNTGCSGYDKFLSQIDDNIKKYMKKSGVYEVKRRNVCKNQKTESVGENPG